MNTVTVSSPGKAILVGEHAVVYGHLGIWTAVDKRMVVNVETGQGLKITTDRSDTSLPEAAIKRISEIINIQPYNIHVNIMSDIRVGSGMGSSAALAVAITGALLKYYGQPWDLKRINAIAFEVEKISHRSPSGGDNTASTYGGFIKYKRQPNADPEIESIVTQRRIENLLVIHSGKPKETTGEMVSKVKDLRQSDPPKFDAIFSRIGEIALEFYSYLSMKSEAIDITNLFKENHRLLSGLQVVSPRTQEMIEKIERVGGAAKISGAGGFLEGSGILLAYHNRLSVLENLSETEGWDIIPATLGEEGVRLE